MPTVKLYQSKHACMRAKEGLLRARQAGCQELRKPALVGDGGESRHLGRVTHPWEREKPLDAAGRGKLHRPGLHLPRSEHKALHAHAQRVSRAGGRPHRRARLDSGQAGVLVVPACAEVVARAQPVPCQPRSSSICSAPWGGCGAANHRKSEEQLGSHADQQIVSQMSMTACRSNRGRHVRTCALHRQGYDRPHRRPMELWWLKFRWLGSSRFSVSTSHA